MARLLGYYDVPDDLLAFIDSQRAHDMAGHGGGAAGPAQKVAPSPPFPRVPPGTVTQDDTAALEAALAGERQGAERNALAQNLFSAGEVFQGRPAKAPAAEIPTQMRDFLLRRQLAAEGQAAEAAKAPPPPEWAAPAGLTRMEALAQGWAKRTEHKPGEGPAPKEWGAPEGMTSDQAIRAGYGHNPKTIDVSHGPATEADKSEMEKRGMNADLAATHADAVHYISQHESAKAALQRSSMAGGAGAALTPQALNMLAAQFATTGNMPPLGMGRAAAAQRAGIVNKAAEVFPETDIASNKATYTANQGSLVKLQTQRDATASFEKTALKNLDIFLNSAKGVVDYGSPLFNMGARKFAERVAGDPKMAQFNAARQTAVQEISKILSGSMGNVAVSDSARKEAQELLTPDASLAQIQAAAQILKQDMHNRMSSFDEQIAEMKGRVKLKKEGGGSTPAPATGGTVIVIWKGKRKEIPAERLDEALQAGAQRAE